MSTGYIQAFRLLWKDTEREYWLSLPMDGWRPDLFKRHMRSYGVKVVVDSYGNYTASAPGTGGQARLEEVHKNADRHPLGYRDASELLRDLV